MRQIIVLPFAEQDIKESVEYYEKKGIGLERQYITILDKSLRFIASNPLSFPIVKPDIRKFSLKRFPFNVYYIYNDDMIYIVAVFHSKRNPANWKSRHIK